MFWNITSLEEYDTRGAYEYTKLYIWVYRSPTGPKYDEWYLVTRTRGGRFKSVEDVDVNTHPEPVMEHTSHRYWL